MWACGNQPFLLVLLIPTLVRTGGDEGNEWVPDHLFILNFCAAISFFNCSRIYIHRLYVHIYNSKNMNHWIFCCERIFTSRLLVSLSYTDWCWWKPLGHYYHLWKSSLRACDVKGLVTFILTPLTEDEGGVWWSMWSSSPADVTLA